MIEFKNIYMSYANSKTYALKDVSFTVNNGEFIFLIGKSGSGKSTIMKLMSCEERPSSGSLVIENINIHTMRRKMVPQLRRNLGLIFQDFRLIPSKTVYENVAFAMEILGKSKKEIKHQVSMVLSVVGLRDKGDKKPHELSGGEQQRVAIARAIVNGPSLVIADEPTGNLDPDNAESIMALLNQINEKGTTVIVCTHDDDLVNKMNKRVIELADGRIIRDEYAGNYNSSVHYNFVADYQMADPYYNDSGSEKSTDELLAGTGIVGEGDLAEFNRTAVSETGNDDIDAFNEIDLRAIGVSTVVEPQLPNYVPLRRTKLKELHFPPAEEAEESGQADEILSATSLLDSEDKNIEACVMAQENISVDQADCDTEKEYKEE